jgi:hypothetical protein
MVRLPMVIVVLIMRSFSPLIQQSPLKNRLFYMKRDETYSVAGE